VLAFGGGLQHHVVVQVRGRADVHDIHRVEQRVQRGKRPPAVLGDEPVNLALVQRMEANQVRRCPGPASRMVRAHETGPDDSYS